MTETDGKSATGSLGRHATVTTAHGDGPTAERVAASVRPDNTDAMTTRVDGDQVVTTITRETTGGLQATVDDYVVNATVAAQCTTDSDASAAEATGASVERTADPAQTDETRTDETQTDATTDTNHE